ncbi:MAG: FAD binding domain-containing protein [Chloroflexi bacterium]|nr:FAD binding domain-containing protein [Chloroflexota bacterium]
MPIREYQRPKDLPAAQAALRQPGATPLMFGPRLPDDPFAGLDTVVDVSRLELNYIRASDAAIRIGAATPLQAIVESPEVQGEAHGLLAEAARLVAPLTLRNLATIGGASQAKDGPPEVKLALLVLDATRAPGDPLAEIVLPRSPQPSPGAALARVARSPRDEAIVAAAAKLSVESGLCRNVRLAVAGDSAQPLRVTSAEILLEGQPWSEDKLRAVVERVLAEAQPVGDYRGSAEYRKEMAGVLARRVLAEARERANN